MQPQQDLAIVLRSVAYEERHRIVTALTENYGQISALARNSIQSRRFGGSLEPFAASLWMFTQRPGAELYSLSEAQIRRPFDGLRRDFKKLALASTFNEIMLKVAPQNVACPELFRLHSNALAALEDAPETSVDIALLNAYLVKILAWSGNQPQLESCLHCGAPLQNVSEEAAITCLIADASWICDRCRATETRHIRSSQSGGFDQLRTTPAAILDLQRSITVPIRQVCSLTQASQQEHKNLFKFLDALFVFHLPGFDTKPLKSVRFLELETLVPLQAGS